MTYQSFLTHGREKFTPEKWTKVNKTYNIFMLSSVLWMLEIYLTCLMT